MFWASTSSRPQPGLKFLRQRLGPTSKNEKRKRLGNESRKAETRHERRCNKNFLPYFQHFRAPVRVLWLGHKKIPAGATGPFFSAKFEYLFFQPISQLHYLIVSKSGRYIVPWNTYTFHDQASHYYSSLLFRMLRRVSSSKPTSWTSIIKRSTET